MGGALFNAYGTYDYTTHGAIESRRTPIGQEAAPQRTSVTFVFHVLATDGYLLDLKAIVETSEAGVIDFYVGAPPTSKPVSKAVAGQSWPNYP